MNFAVSNKHTGPWSGDEERADQALSKGRAMWGAGITIYVAEVRPVKPSDGLPSVVSFIGEVRERLVDKFGTGADVAFDDRSVMAKLESGAVAFAEEFDALIDSTYGLDFAIPVQVKAYGRDSNVKVGDFK